MEKGKKPKLKPYELAENVICFYSWLEYHCSFEEDDEELEIWFEAFENENSILFDTSDIGTVVFLSDNDDYEV
jgi:hypothetical protein